MICQHSTTHLSYCVYSTSTQTSHAWCMQAAFHILSSKETTNPQHMSYSSSSYTLPPPFIPQPKHFLLQSWLCNRQPHCCVICVAKTNDNDQTQETQGRTSGGHLPSWNVRRVRRGTQAPVRGRQRTKNTKSHTTAESFHNNDLFFTINKNMEKYMPRSYGRTRCMWCTTQEKSRLRQIWIQGRHEVRQTEPQNTNFMFLYQLKKKTLTHT